MEGAKLAIIKSLVSILATVVIIGGFIAAIANASDASGSLSNLGDLTGFTDLGDYIVKVDEPGAMPAMNKAQVKAGIEACYKGQTKENLLSVLDDLISVQNQYKVNAAFMVVTTIIESSGGIDWKNIKQSTHNWMSVSYGSAWNGASGETQHGSHNWCVYSSFNEAIQKFGVYMTESSHYFKKGRYKVEEIAIAYNNNGRWYKQIQQELDKFYSSVVSLQGGASGSGGAVAAEGDGYSKTYTNGNKTYRLYEQWTGSYASSTWAGSSIKSGGCGPSSVATIISGYGINQNPLQVTQECSSATSKYGARTIASLVAYFEHYGLSAKSGSFNRSAESTIVNHLKAGNPVLALITRPMQLIGGERASTSRHYVTLLGINSQNQIMVGDPGSSKTDGFTTMDIIYNKVGPETYILVSK